VLKKLDVVLRTCIQISLIIELQDSGVTIFITASSFEFWGHIQKEISAANEVFQAAKGLHWCEQDTTHFDLHQIFKACKIDVGIT
jgi:hypothetical protein